MKHRLETGANSEKRQCDKHLLESIKHQKKSQRYSNEAGVVAHQLKVPATSLGDMSSWDSHNGS